MLFSWNFRDIAQYLLLPFVGSILAVVFYEFVFVKSQEYLNDGDSDDNKELDVDHKNGKLELDVDINDN